MKIIIISATAPPEPLTTGRINWDLANHLAAEGNEVWLISPKPSRPLGEKYGRPSGVTVSKIKYNFTHVNINSFTYPKYNLFLRAYESLDFGIRSIRYINRRIRNYSLIYACPWPFFGQLMILVLRKNKNIPLIMNVQDLYPESFLTRIESGTLTKILQPLYSIDKLIAEKSTHVTVISESLRQVYLNNRKISSTKISVVHNWQDPEEFSGINIPKEDIIKKYNIIGATGKFIFMYLGNIGPVAGVETILHSFSRLNNDKSYLVIAGSGTARDKCQSLAQKLKIDRLSFVEVPLGVKHVAELQSISDILLLPIIAEAANSSVPSKLIAYMFSKKPVITSASINTETATAIKNAGCGWITGTNDPADWTEAMQLTYNTSTRILDEMGQSGFDYAIKNYSKEEGLKQISKLIHSLTQNNSD